MSLSRKQAEFLQDIACLITWVARDELWEGDEVYFTAGDFHATSGHMPKSLHYSRLAADLNLFVNGKYITGEHPYWIRIANTWKSLHEGNRWGGDFTSRDLNHFSREHEGRA